MFRQTSIEKCFFNKNKSWVIFKNTHETSHKKIWFLTFIQMWSCWYPNYVSYHFKGPFTQERDRIEGYCSVNVTRMFAGWTFRDVNPNSRKDQLDRLRICRRVQKRGPFLQRRPPRGRKRQILILKPLKNTTFLLKIRKTLTKFIKGKRVFEILKTKTCIFRPQGGLRCKKGPRFWTLRQILSRSS